jgi:hypothetical protein
MTTSQCAYFFNLPSIAICYLLLLLSVLSHLLWATKETEQGWFWVRDTALDIFGVGLQESVWSIWHQQNRPHHSWFQPICVLWYVSQLSCCFNCEIASLLCSTMLTRRWCFCLMIFSCKSEGMISSEWECACTACHLLLLSVQVQPKVEAKAGWTSTSSVACRLLLLSVQVHPK